MKCSIVIIDILFCDTFHLISDVFLLVKLSSPLCSKISLIRIVFLNYFLYETTSSAPSITVNDATW